MPPPGPLLLLRSFIGGRPIRLADAPGLGRAACRLASTTCRHAGVPPQTLPAVRLRCRHFSHTPLRPASAAARSSRTAKASTSASPPPPPSTTPPDDQINKPSYFYFISNNLLDRVAGLSPGSAIPSSVPPGVSPGRQRRYVQRQQAKLDAKTLSAAAAADADAKFRSDGLFANASTVLADMAAQQRESSLSRLASSLLSLTKPRLTVLVVLTAMAPYALYPVPSFLSPGIAEAPSLSPLTLLFLTTGTALCSASANALNMLYEPYTDARMSRTRNRPLVRGLISRRAALLFAVGCGVAGVAALEWGVNPTTAFLGAANIALYAGVYTPMKRLSVLNTWVGALVGGIPPLMGWTAAAGEASTSPREFRELLFAPDGSSTGGWLLAALLFAWQFPHFMALSWAVRHEYRRAGLRMLAWVDPARNGRVALRYAAAFVPICMGLCAAGVTSWTFAVTSLPVNLWLVLRALVFWRFEGRRGSARALFWASVWHLPALMVLALLQKKGMWTRVYRSVVGEPVYEEEEDEFYDDDEEDEEDDEYETPGKQPVAQPVAQSVASSR